MYCNRCFQVSFIIKSYHRKISYIFLSFCELILFYILTVIAIEQFGMAPEQNGMMLSYIGVISLFMQGIGIASLTKWHSDKTLMTLSTTTLTISYFVLVCMTIS